MPDWLQVKWWFHPDGESFNPIRQWNVGNVRQETIICFLLQLFVFSMFKMFWLIRVWRRTCFGFKYLVGKCPNDLSKISGFVRYFLAGNVPMLMKYIWFCWHIYLIIYPVLFWLKIPGSVVTISAFLFWQLGWICETRYRWNDLVRWVFFCREKRKVRWGGWRRKGGWRVSRKKARFTWQPPARRELWVLPGLKMLRRCQWCAQPGGRKDAADLARGTWLDGCVS